MLCISVVALAALCLFASAPSAHASSGGSLALGTVTGNTLMVACGGGQWLSGMTCHSATITGCPSVDNINFIYGYLPPAGTPQGIIVYFDGGDGTSAVGEATELQMLSYYASQNYGVVEIAWATAWEQTTNANIQNAACRPATFLNFIYSGIYQSIATGTGGNPNAGMCAQGYSAGSAAVAYSLAYYGAGGPVGTGGYLDAVELISGPVLSDIKQGCMEPNAPNVTVCPAGSSPECQLGSDSPWTLPPVYVNTDANYLKAWANDNTCQNTYPTFTSSASNAAWLAQSIVDQSNLTGLGAAPSFSYPNTAVSGWLCRNLLKTDPTCPNAKDYLGCPNNSSTQGQIFYSQVTTGTSPFNVYSVDGCQGPEAVPSGTVSALTVVYGGQAPSGEVAVENDMAGYTPLFIPARCVRRSH
jgi:hypothetical protein